MFLTEQHKGLGSIQSEHTKAIRTEIVERWEETGLLEGLEGRMKENIAQLYENTANFILNETVSTSTAGSFETIAFPLIRRTFAKLLLNDIVTVQALNYTIGKLFFFRPLILQRNANNTHSPVQGAYANQPIYNSSDALNSYLPSAESKTLYDGFFADNYAEFGDSATIFDRSKSDYSIATSTVSTGPIPQGTPTVQCFITGFSVTNQGKVVGPAGIAMDSEEFLASLKITAATTLTSVESTAQIAAGDPVPFFVRALKYGNSLVNPSTGAIEIYLDLRTPVATGGYSGFTLPTYTTTGGTLFTASWRQYVINENDADMAEVTFDLQEVTVAVERPRKMRAQWTPELSMDVQRYQNIDAEAELTNLLSETIASEIDSEGLRDISRVAAWTGRFDYNGLRRQSTTYYGTQKDWNQGLIEVINQIDAQIYKATLDGGANYIVCSPEVTALFRNLEYFHIANAGNPAETTKYNMGIERVGALNNRYVVYQNVKFPPGLILIGRKGDSPMKSGYVYCPYQPITLTPVMTDFRTFSNIRGIMTRYGKKVINNKYFGKIIVDGLTYFPTTDLR